MENDKLMDVLRKTNVHPANDQNEEQINHLASIDEAVNAIKKIMILFLILSLIGIVIAALK